MEIKELQLKNVYEITLKPQMDSRGFFMRTFDAELFDKIGINNQWVQENQSRSIQKGIIRGLHLQLPPFTEAKLVRCIKGSVIDVFVDLRAGSYTFGQWGKIEISEKNKKLVYIPRGFAHGYCTLTTESEVLYKVDNFYSKAHEVGIIWNDKDIKINWPTEKPTLSEKDLKNITFKDFVDKYSGINP